jgi:hypothetical protein
MNINPQRMHKVNVSVVQMSAFTVLFQADAQCALNAEQRKSRWHWEKRMPAKHAGIGTVGHIY